MREKPGFLGFESHKLLKVYPLSNRIPVLIHVSWLVRYFVTSYKQIQVTKTLSNQVTIHMAAKKVKTIIKLNLKAGEATAAPPVGPALGQHGLPIMEFVKAYNEKTSKLKGEVIPAVITVFEDRTFTFITKLPPVSAMIIKTLSLAKGGGKAGREVAGKLTQAQVKQIATDKLPDLNTDSVEAGMKVVAGTARSMGIDIESS